LPDVEPVDANEGLRKIRLHDSRHTTLSLMEKAGVPISIVSKSAGGTTTPRSP
jgi:hypothetical protein